MFGRQTGPGDGAMGGGRRGVVGGRACFALCGVTVATRFLALACKTLGQAAADLAILEAAALMPNRESRCDLQQMACRAWAAGCSVALKRAGIARPGPHFPLSLVLMFQTARFRNR